MYDVNTKWACLLFQNIPILLLGLGVCLEDKLLAEDCRPKWSVYCLEHPNFVAVRLAIRGHSDQCPGAKFIIHLNDDH